MSKDKMGLQLKNKTGIIFTVFVIIILSVAVLIWNLQEHEKSGKFNEQIQLGQKYLEEMNYEQAIAAFEKAFEIDPKSEVVCAGLTDAYIGMADMYIDEVDIEKAVEYLEEGYALVRDDRLEEKILEIEKKSEKDQYEKAVYDEYEESEESVMQKEPKTENSNKSYSNRDLSKFLTTVICCLRKDYSAEYPDHEALLEFGRYYYENFDYEKIMWDERFSCVIKKKDIDDVLRTYFDVEVPPEDSEEVSYRDGKYYYSGDYADLGMPLAVIKHVDITKDGTYQITFYDAYIYPEDFESGEENPIEDWDIYYDYEAEDAEKDKFCEINGEGTCKLREADGRLIVVEFRRNK